jgi:hypothetical protein
VSHTDGKTPKLADPDHHAVKAALRITCPSCGAHPGQHCRGLHRRIVHYARCTMKDSR